jgi:hypothetical protein
VYIYIFFTIWGCWSAKKKKKNLIKWDSSECCVPRKSFCVPQVRHSGLCDVLVTHTQFGSCTKMYCDTIVPRMLYSSHCVCQQTEELKERKGHIGRDYKCSFLRASRRLLTSASCLAHSGVTQSESDLVKSYLE